MKGPIGRTIVVHNKGEDARTQLLHAAATEPGKQATDEDREPNLNLVEPGTVSGSVAEVNAMAWISEKGGTTAHAGEMTAFALDA